MNIKQILKSNMFTRNLGKRLNTSLQFGYDARDFNNNYIEVAEKKGDFKYSILLLVHSLEKGMCFENPRPFGGDKAKYLVRMLQNYTDEQKKEFEYRVGISVLFSWVDFYVSHGWEKETAFDEIKGFLEDKNRENELIAGVQEFIPAIVDANDSELFGNILFSRHSVRNFQDKKIKYEDIEFALKCFVETPTACNRQMCRVYYIENKDVKSLLDEVIVGISGINKETVQYFVITYDLASFAYSGERQQGMFNAGLCTMNFINGLHIKGIGSCCLQWSNKYSQDEKVRKAMLLSDSERIGIIVGAGYYLDKNLVPCSVRRDPKDIYKII